MAELHVDPSGLHAAATECEAVSTALAETSTPPTGGHVTQASAAAVAHGHALVDAIASRLAVRATSTGYQLHTASGVYRRTDGDSESAITTTVQV
jgi:hypothetical protein